MVKGRLAPLKCLFHDSTQIEKDRFTLIEHTAHLILAFTNSHIDGLEIVLHFCMNVATQLVCSYVRSYVWMVAGCLLSPYSDAYKDNSLF